ncbi:MAG: hypothetical protein KAS32_12305 [Candidatus Peribacteraceae bacterium]|nr:hypothetical protein [Candidatus Peribacteraceae bacterium]
MTTKKVVKVELTEIEKLQEKIAKLKLVQEEQMAKIKVEQQKLKDEAKVLKEEEKKAKVEEKELKAKVKAEKLQEMMKNGKFEVKVNKSQIIREHMINGLTKEQIVTETGYTNKFVLDNMWRIEKSLGLR